MLVPKTIFAVAGDQSRSATIWFIKISKKGNAENNCEDDCNHSIMINLHYLEGHYLERDSEISKHKNFNIMKKMVYKSGKIIIDNADIVDIVLYAENNELAASGISSFYMLSSNFF